jgi:uncharacterized protein
MIELGRVEALFRYPVKSMAGVAEPRLELKWRGFSGDREYAFRKAGDLTAFPWLTGRDLSEMVLYRAQFRDPSDLRKSPVDVTAPDGEVFELRDLALSEKLARAAGCGAELIHIGRGAYDSMPVSLFGRATMDDLSRAHGTPLDVRRFRPNIVLDRGDERDWIGTTLVFGDPATGPRLTLNKPIERCAMITIDPDTGARDPSVMRTVAQSFANERGAYASVERPGFIAVGDTVWR